MKNNRKTGKRTGLVISLFLACVLCFGTILVQAEEEFEDTAVMEGTGERDSSVPEIEGLTFEKQMEFTYVECADVYYYEGGYKYIRVYDSADYLLIPEDGVIPEGMDVPLFSALKKN